VRTRVGYAGGEQPDPTYQHMGDHTEALQLDYDPAALSYVELLELFWNSHDPLRQAYSRQYMSAIFYHDPTQQAEATRSRDQLAQRLGGSIVCEILPAGRFYLAEDYHQKYRLRQAPQPLSEFEQSYPDPIDFLNSTAVARVNGLLGGHGTDTTPLDQLGLSAAALSRLRGQG